MTKIFIKKIREFRGITLRQLEEETGISRSQLSRIENNESMPTIDELCEIAYVLSVPLEETFEFNHIEKNPQSE